MNKALWIRTLLLSLLIWCAGSAVLWIKLPYKPRATLTVPEDLTFAAFSPNGKIIATKSRHIPPVVKGMRPNAPNGPVRLWDMDSGKQIASFAEEGRYVWRVFLSDDGKIVVLESFYEAGRDRSISIFEVQSGRELNLIRQRPFSLPFLPLGIFPHTALQLVITPLRLTPYPDMQYCFLSPDGKTLVFDSPWKLEKWLIIWDISENGIRQISDQLPSAFSPKGDLYDATSPTLDAEGNWQGETILRDVATRRVVARTPWQANDFLFSPDGALVAAEVRNESAHGQREVKVWDVANSQELATLEGALVPVFSRNGKRLAVRELDLRNVKVWDTTTWQEMHELSKALENKTKGSISQIVAGPGDEDFRAVVFENRNYTPNRFRQWLEPLIGNTTPATSHGSTDLEIVDIATSKVLFELNLADTSWLGGQRTGAAAVYLSRDGRTLVFEPQGKANSDGSHSIRLFSIPPDRWVGHIILWPFVAALLVLFAVPMTYLPKRKQNELVTPSAMSQQN